MYKQRTSTCSTCSLRAPAALVNFLRRDARTVPGQLSLKDAASSSSALAPTQPINIEFHSLRPWHLRELLDSLHLHLIVLSQLQLQSQPMKIYRYLGLSPTVFSLKGTSIHLIVLQVPSSAAPTKTTEQLEQLPDLQAAGAAKHGRLISRTLDELLTSCSIL